MKSFVEMPSVVALHDPMLSRALVFHIYQSGVSYKDLDEWLLPAASH
jgi:hypothetical protein